MSNSRSEMAIHLEDIIVKTVQGEIDWSKTNSSVYSWQKRDGGLSFVTTIQRTVIPRRAASAHKSRDGVAYAYHFVVKEHTPGSSSRGLVVNTRERPEFHELLEKLYDAVVINADSIAAEMLGRLLR